MLNTKEDKRSRTQQKIDSIIQEIEDLELKKKEAWDSIKDFTVSANKADEVYARMARMTSAINRLNGERKKLEKQL